MANSGASQAIRKSGATTLANVSVGGGGNFAENEVPSGAVNGSNADFTLANTPTAGSVAVYLNGVRQKSGAGNDYTISGAIITFATAPLTGDVILCDYRY